MSCRRWPRQPVTDGGHQDRLTEGQKGETGMRNLSIKMRLIAPLGIMGVLLIAVGVMGVVGLSRSNDSLNNMYTRDLSPTTQIAEIRELLLRNRLAIAVSMVTPTPAVIQANTSEIDKNLTAIGKIWDEYMAGQMNAARRKLAETFFEHRKKFVQGGLRPAIELLRAGKIDQTRQHVVDAIRPLYKPVGEGIAGLTKFQTDAAKKRFEEAAQEAALLRNVAIA